MIKHDNATNIQSTNPNKAEMLQEDHGMPPQDLPDRAPYFSRAASSGRTPSESWGCFEADRNQIVLDFWRFIIIVLVVFLMLLTDFFLKYFNGMQ